MRNVLLMLSLWALQTMIYGQWLPRDGSSGSFGSQPNNFGSFGNSYSQPFSSNSRPPLLDVAPYRPSLADSSRYDPIRINPPDSSSFGQLFRNNHAVNRPTNFGDLRNPAVPNYNFLGQSSILTTPRYGSPRNFGLGSFIKPELATYAPSFAQVGAIRNTLTEPINGEIGKNSARIPPVYAPFRNQPDSSRFDRVINIMLPPNEGKFARQRDGYGVDRSTKDEPNRIHEGVDFNYNVGQTGINLRHPTIYSPVEGTVESVSKGKGTWGIATIRTSDGFAHQILHMHDIHVKQRDKVSVNDPIGIMGGQGKRRQYPHHVHYQIRDGRGRTVDPATYHNSRQD